MKTADFLRHVADLVEKGLPDPIRIGPPWGMFDGQILVAADDVPAWATHLKVTPRWVPGQGADRDREFLDCRPDPTYGILLTACRARQAVSA